jgi:16S rRNA (uracil1498-N3)-methyltransferase
VSAAEARRRFRVAALDTDAGGILDPGPAVLRHLRVLRAAVGDEIYLFDGRGGEVRAVIAVLDGDGVRVRVIDRVLRDVESPLTTCLVQAVPARAARMETIVRQATELGVGRIVPVVARRSQQSRGSAAGRRRLTQRWRRIADSAAEQCGRTRVPEIDDPAPYAELDWEGLPRPLLLAHPAAGGGEPARSLALSGGERPGGATVLVGPEGGWSDDEIEVAAAHGAERVRLGPRVLRADSAGTVALAVLQYLWGDLDG